MKTPTSMLPSCFERFRAEQNGPEYLTRMMAAIAGALLLVVAALNLPVRSEISFVGWSTSLRSEIRLIETSEFKKPREVDSVVQTAFVESQAIKTPDAETRTEVATEQAGAIVPESRSRRLQARQVLEFAETPPSIQGGLGSYYINIEYPAEAAARGIEGRLVLRFVVEPDGSTSDVAVFRSLHPLCDSAAVRALRKTHFVPGQQNGEFVPVKMSLPVRFRLVEPGSDVRGRTRLRSRLDQSS